jgi:hypothetical protein
VTNQHDNIDDQLQGQIEGLTRDLAEKISAAPLGQRERWRDMAVHLLRDEVETSEPRDAAPPAAAGSFNSFGIAIPLLLAGAVLLPLFGAAGLVLCAAALVMMTWGIASVLLGGRQP